MNQPTKQLVKPPVVVILGHVDHGKTSILDHIRTTKVVEKESGGITQHTGAYQIEHNDKKITFIDTPGHEMFSAMRSRGAQVADIAILVVAAEEGVKPQTKEAIEHIQEAKIPLIVAINKIDKKEAQPEKVKGELTKYNITVESLGGEVPSVNVSAKTGQGIDELLEMINLVADMAELKYDPEAKTSGVVIESHHCLKRGVTVTLLVKDGVLNRQDILGTKTAYGKIKTMEDFQLQNIDQAIASTPIIITGLNQNPHLGEIFQVFETIKEAEANIEKQEDTEETRQADNSDKKIINIILKADVTGCLEALKDSLKVIGTEEADIKIIKADIGDIIDSDIKLAESTNSKIVGFHIKPSTAIQKLSQQRKVTIITFDIVYELIQGLRQLLSKVLEPESIETVLGEMKVIAVFRTEKDRQIVGGKVTKGIVKQGSSIRVLRNGEKVGEGRILQLQRGKKEADEVAKDQECGILYKGSVTLEEKDILEFYKIEKKKRII